MLTTPPRALGAAVVVAAAAIAVAPSVAQAQYLDPGGSLIVQAVIAVVIGVSAPVKLYWHRISGFLGKRARDKESK